MEDQEALEELAGMLEVIRALAEMHGANGRSSVSFGQTKPRRAVGLQERVYLIDVDEA